MNNAWRATVGFYAWWPIAVFGVAVLGIMMSCAFTGGLPAPGSGFVFIVALMAFAAGLGVRGRDALLDETLASAPGHGRRHCSLLLASAVMLAGGGGAVLATSIGTLPGIGVAACASVLALASAVLLGRGIALLLAWALGMGLVIPLVLLLENGWVREPIAPFIGLFLLVLAGGLGWYSWKYAARWHGPLHLPVAWTWRPLSTGTGSGPWRLACAWLYPSALVICILGAAAITVFLALLDERALIGAACSCTTLTFGTFLLSLVGRSSGTTPSLPGVIGWFLVRARSRTSFAHQLLAAILLTLALFWAALWIGIGGGLLIVYPGRPAGIPWWLPISTALAIPGMGGLAILALYRSVPVQMLMLGPIMLGTSFMSFSFAYAETIALVSGAIWMVVSIPLLRMAFQRLLAMEPSS